MKFKTQLTAKDIFKFSLAFTYLGSSGIFSAFMVLVGIVMCVRGAAFHEGTKYVFMGIVILVLLVIVNPLLLYIKAKKQALTNPVYQKPSYYTLTEEGIHIEIEEESADITWAQIWKLKHVFGEYILYTGKQQAFVFPEEAFGAQKEEISSFIENCVKTSRGNGTSKAGKDGAGAKSSKSSIAKYAKGNGQDIQKEENSEE